ncbi:hypothetical protein GW813_06470 [bacterium]|nr:hypothetical protein [bacterium]PJA74874.1 MAG: hypothetical protein CO151_07985 [bacterium CG_4_9_14_3_um_filter_65_15]
MKPIPDFLAVTILAVLGLVSCSAGAWRAPEVQAVSCSLRHEVYAMASSTPGWCWWDYPA